MFFGRIAVDILYAIEVDLWHYLTALDKTYAPLDHYQARLPTIKGDAVILTSWFSQFDERIGNLTRCLEC